MVLDGINRRALSLGGVLCVPEVLLEVTKKPLDRCLIIVVTLALDDDLLSTVDELVATLLGEVFLGEPVLGAFEVLVCAILVLLGDTTHEVVLELR